MSTSMSTGRHPLSTSLPLLAIGHSSTPRWVGSQVQANGVGTNSNNTSQTAPVQLPSEAKTIPCIVVSPETSDDEGGSGFDWDTKKTTDEAGLPFIDNNGDNDDIVDRTSDSVDDVDESNKSTYAQDLPQIKGRRNTISSLPDKQRMMSLDIPRKKTRRNSINDMMMRAGSQMNLSRSPSRINLGNNSDWRSEARDSLICTLSALYAKLLFVIGLAFPVADIISGGIPKSLFLGYYLFLYMTSLFFMAYIYFFLLSSSEYYIALFKDKFLQLRRMCMRNRPEVDKTSIAPSYKPPKFTYNEHDHGSMYLKLGCVLFGIGGMIFSGLEVGQYFEITHEPGDECGNALLFWVPGACLLFTFMQMYFIVLNSRVIIKKYSKTARFGLMHMVGTNLCTWLYILAQEAKHTIHNLHEGHHGDDHGGHHGENSGAYHGDKGHHAPVQGLDHSDEHNSLEQHDDDNLQKLATTVATYANDILKSRVHRAADAEDHCRQGAVLGALVDKAAPFLFPCAIEYSLIGAAVCYIIWKHIGAKEHKDEYDDIDSEVSCYIQKKARHHYSVDCAHASRGLFMGILIMVFTIIYLIIVKNAGIQDSMRTTSLIIELMVYLISLVATIIGMYQVQELEFERENGVELDIILLIIAQSGVYVYTSFNIIGSSFWSSDADFLHIFTTLLKLIQATVQSIFVLDASRRKIYTPEQEDKKPGREMVIFLLICNLAMWFLNVFKSSHPDEYPTQLKFYGVWAWTIISHISMPLAIFYRYHITVCLGEIWKRTYKIKEDW